MMIRQLADKIWNSGTMMTWGSLVVRIGGLGLGLILRPLIALGLAILLVFLGFVVIVLVVVGALAFGGGTLFKDPKFVICAR